MISLKNKLLAIPLIFLTLAFASCGVINLNTYFKTPALDDCSGRYDYEMKRCNEILNPISKGHCIEGVSLENSRCYDLNVDNPENYEK